MDINNYKLYDNMENRFNVYYDNNISKKILNNKNFLKNKCSIWNDDYLKNELYIKNRHDDKYNYLSLFDKLDRDKNLSIWIGINKVNLNSEQFEYILENLKDELKILFKYLKNDNEKLIKPYSYINEKYRLDWSDFRTINNLNIINKYIDFNNKKSITLLDIGGGYGRLTEAIMKLYPNKNIKIVLLDNYINSLVYAFSYLKKKLPNKKICNIYENNNYNFDDYDIIIIDYENFIKMNNIKFDIITNIHSFQEMDKKNVNNYLKLANKVIKKNGRMYFENCLNYKCKYDYNIPLNWKYIIREKTAFASKKYNKYDITMTIEKVNNCDNLNWNYIKDLKLKDDKINYII